MLKLTSICKASADVAFRQRFFFDGVKLLTAIPQVLNNAELDVRQRFIDGNAIFVRYVSFKSTELRHKLISNNITL